MKHLRTFLRAAFILFALLVSSMHLSAQKVDYDALSKSPNIESVKLSGIMLRMGLSMSKRSNSDGRNAAKALRGIKKMYVFSSENKKGREEILKGFFPLIEAKSKDVHVLLEREDKREGERVWIVAVSKGEDRFETLLILSEESDEVNAVVMIGDMHKNDLMDLSKSTGKSASLHISYESVGTAEA